MAQHSKRSSSRAARQPAGQVRVIGGRWGGRKLSVADAKGLRPTGDRVRETLFNWLQMSIPDADCLDLFAGSGALGLEAASRDARFVTLVESNQDVINTLKHSLELLGCKDEVQLQPTTAAHFLRSNKQQYDIVFIDPPFDQRLQLPILQELSKGHLRPEAMVYVELQHGQFQESELPDGFIVSKQKRFGDVTVFLLRFE